MKRVQVAIIGGGVSGLYAAFLLEKMGVDYVLLEGREHAGGRIQSLHPLHDDNSLVRATPQLKHRVDLGATWVWPEFQTELAALLDELNIPLIPQQEQGDMLLERAAHLPVSRHSGYVSSPASMRLAGGMRVLVETLQEKLKPARLLFSHRVTELTATGEEMTLRGETHHGERFSIQTQHIFLALPPALAARLNFDPPLPATLNNQWLTSATWMAAHAKYVAIYAQPFWREQGLSGEARSGVGPLVEIHDASVPTGVTALFGFMGIPAKTRWTMTESNLKALCRAQLVRLFGEQAARPVAEFFKDWASDDLTATTADLTATAGHSVPAAVAHQGLWQGRLQGIAAEWSPNFPGYVAGALEAAEQGVLALMARQSAVFANSEIGE